MGCWRSRPGTELEGLGPLELLLPDYLVGGFLRLQKVPRYAVNRIPPPVIQLLVQDGVSLLVVRFLFCRLVREVAVNLHRVDVIYHKVDLVLLTRKSYVGQNQVLELVVLARPTQRPGKPLLQIRCLFPMHKASQSLVLARPRYSVQRHLRGAMAQFIAEGFHYASRRVRAKELPTHFWIVFTNFRITVGASITTCSPSSSTSGERSTKSSACFAPS